MSQNWITIKSSNKLYELELLKGVLNENSIPSVILNKQDSSYLNFGEAELKVLSNDLEKAYLLINQKNE